MKFVMIVFLFLFIGCASVTQQARKGHNCTGWKDFEIRHGRIFSACTRSISLPKNKYSRFLYKKIIYF